MVGNLASRDFYYTLPFVEGGIWGVNIFAHPFYFSTFQPPLRFALPLLSKEERKKASRFACSKKNADIIARGGCLFRHIVS
jgi:hypothetical protein